jgi:hypothetical protein
MDEQRLVAFRKSVLDILARPGGTMVKLDAILDDPASTELVQALSPSEFFFLIRDIGPDDAGSLMMLASEEQLGRSADFFLWSGRELAVERLDRWLRLAQEAGDAVLGKVLTSLDPELLVVQILKLARVVEYLDDPEQMDMLGAEEGVLRSPDGCFHLICGDNEDATVQCRNLLEILYTFDHEKARLLLKAAVWELPASLEEEAQRIREGRLEDLGFPPYEEAQEIYELYAPGDAVRELQARAGKTFDGRVPDNLDAVLALTALEARKESLLAATMRALPESTREALRQATIYLMNRILVVESKGDLSNAPELTYAATRAQDLMNLGLEQLTLKAGQKASQVLESLHPVLLFRTGYSLLLGLRRDANSLRTKAALGGRFGLLDDPPLGPALAGLARFVPQFFDGIKGEADLSYRDFCTLGDLDSMRRYLAHAKVRLDFLFDTLHIDPAKLRLLVPEKQQPFVTASTLAATALANLMIGREGVDPLGPPELQNLLDLLLPWDDSEGARKPDAFLVARMEQALVGQPTEVQELIRFSVAKLVKTLGHLPEGQAIETKYLGSALLFVGD